MYILTIGFTDRPSKTYLDPAYDHLYCTARVLLLNEKTAQFAFIVDAHNNLRIHVQSKHTPNGIELTELTPLTTE